MEVKKELFKCTKCNKSFAGDIYLQKHLYLHDQKQCRFCDNWFSTHALLLKHVAASHRDKVVKSECYQCEHCNSRFTDEDLLKNHLATVHSDSKIYECKLCHAHFDESIQLTIHQLQCKEEKLVRDKPYRCDICNKHYGRYEYLQRHIKIHSDHRPFKCDDCDRTFILKDQLRRHEKQHSIEKGEIVEEAQPKKFFKCDFCPKMCSTYGNLLDHRRVHTKEKPFKCLICLKSYARNGALKVHTRIHTGERPFECQFCGMTFYHISHRGRHEKYHHKHERTDEAMTSKESTVKIESLRDHESTVAANIESPPKRNCSKKSLKKPPSVHHRQSKYTLEIFKISESDFELLKKDGNSTEKSNGPEL